MEGNIILIALVFLTPVFAANMHNKNEPEAVKYLHMLNQLDISDQQNEIQHMMDMYGRLDVQDLRDELERQVAETEGNTTCLQDIMTVLGDMGKNQSYTLRMFDAFGKLSSGFLQGNIQWYGNYDECRDVVTPETYNFTGKYCLANYKMPKIPAAIYGGNYGMCMPSSCSASDITALINAAVNVSSLAITNLTQYIELKAVFCDEERVISNGGKVAIAILSILGAVCVASTLYDLVDRLHAHQMAKRRAQQKQRFQPVDTYADDDDDPLLDQDSQVDLDTHNDKKTNKGTIHKVALCFSFVTNGEKILDTSKKSGSLDCIHGIRVLSMFWVMLGHTYVFGMGEVANPFGLFKMIQRFTFQAIVNATFSVDSFFFLSGFLLAYLTIKHLKEEDGQMNWALFYFHRFWRLTPVYMIVLMFYTTVYHNLFGPLGISMQGDDPQCTKYWWSNLLYINNFVPGGMNGMCMAWAWYLANDMQFFVVSPILLYLLHRWNILGVAMTSLALLGGIIASGVYSRVEKVEAVFTGQMNNQFTTDIYIQPQYRIAAYLVGILAGYIYYELRKRKIVSWSQVVVFVGWCSAVAINLAVLYGLYSYYHDGKAMNIDVSAFYESVSRPAWCVGLAWLTIACLSGYGGPVNMILSWGFWVPLSRLTYSAYLVHPMLMYVTYTNLRTPIYVTDLTMVYYFLAHVVLSYALAFVTSLLVEAPMMGLEKLVFPSKSATKKPKTADRTVLDAGHQDT